MNQEGPPPNIGEETSWCILKVLFDLLWCMCDFRIFFWIQMTDFLINSEALSKIFPWKEVIVA